MSRFEINKEFTDFFNDSDQTALPFRFRRYRLGARWNPGRRHVQKPEFTRK